MLGLFKADPYDDPVLGRLERRKGHWRGDISLPETGSVPLAVIGNRTAPDTECLAAVRDFAPRYEMLRPRIAAALAEHRQNGLDAPDSDAGQRSASIWKGVRVSGVLADRWSVTRKGSAASGPVVVVEYETEWDEDHTLGAVIDGDELIELNGSVLSVF